MKRILLALSAILGSLQMQAQLPVYWQTGTPGSFTISGNTIRNVTWASGFNYANSLQKLTPGRDGYVEFAAETPITTGVAYQVGFARASTPSVPIITFMVQAGTNPATTIYPALYDPTGVANTYYSGSCSLIPASSVLRIERKGNVVRFWNMTAGCELLYSSSPINIPATEDWVVIFKGSGDGVVSGAVNTKVSFGGADELWGRVTPTGISPLSLTDRVGIGKIPAVELDVLGTASISTLSGSGNALVEATSNGTLQRKGMGLGTQALLGDGSWGDVTNFSPWKNAVSPTGAIYFQPASGRYVGINLTSPAANLDIVNTTCDNKPALKITTDETIGCTVGNSHGDLIDLGANTLSGFAQRFIVKSNGSVGINRVPSYTLDAAGQIRVVATLYPSDQRFKKNIEEINQPIDLLRQLSGKTYHYKAKEFPQWNFNEKLQYGFIAQELKKVMPELVEEDKDGYLAVNYTMLIPVLTAAINEQQKEIEVLTQELAALKESKASQTQTAVADVKADDPYLAQNVPNPFNRTTIISYKLPAAVSNAAIGLYDLNGREIQLFHLERKKAGSITINGGELKPGMYVYTLIIDGKYFDSKKMILTSE